MKFTQKQLNDFEDDVRKNADTILVFCNERGMSPIQAGAACDWVVQCIRKAITAHEKNPITQD